MGPYLFATSALTGFFLFGSIYHFILWSRARRSWTLLLFAIVTFLSAIVSYALLSLATAQTTETAQWALNLRGSVALATVASSVLIFW